MVIEPVKNKKTGKIYTNIEICHIMKKELDKLTNGVGAKTKDERENMEIKAQKICGGSDRLEQVQKYLNQICSITDPDEAQRIFAKTIIPVVDK